MAWEFASEFRAARFKLPHWGQRTIRSIGGAVGSIISHQTISHVLSFGRWRGKGVVPAWYMYYLLLSSTLLGFSLWWEWSTDPEVIKLADQVDISTHPNLGKDKTTSKLEDLDYSGLTGRLSPQVDLQRQMEM